MRSASIDPCPAIGRTLEVGRLRRVVAAGVLEGVGEALEQLGRSRRQPVIERERQALTDEPEPVVTLAHSREDVPLEADRPGLEVHATRLARLPPRAPPGVRVLR